MFKLHSELQLCDGRKPALMACEDSLNGMGYLQASEDSNIVYYIKVVDTFSKDDQHVNLSYILHRPGYVNIDPKMYPNAANVSMFASHKEHGPETVIQVRITPCLTCEGWPTTAALWPYRKRENAWPVIDTVHEIMKYGFHIAPENPENLPDSEWKVIFGKAEAKLIQELNSIQLMVYQVIMHLFSECIKGVNFNLGNILKHHLFWEFEKQDSDIWTTDKISEAVLDTLDQFINSLKKEFLPNYFIPEQNMLEELTQETKLFLLERANQIRKDAGLVPIQYLKTSTPWEGGKLCQFGRIQLAMQEKQHNLIKAYENFSPDVDKYYEMLSDMILKAVIDHISLNIILACDAKDNKLLSQVQVSLVEKGLGFAYCTVKQITAKLNSLAEQHSCLVNIDQIEEIHKLCFSLSYKLEVLVSSVLAKNLNSARSTFTEMEKSVENCSHLGFSSLFKDYRVEALAAPGLWSWYNKGILLEDGLKTSQNPSSHFQRTLEKVEKDLYEGNRSHDVYFIQLQCNNIFATFVEGSRIFYPNLLKLFMEEPDNEEFGHLPVKDEKEKQKGSEEERQRGRLRVKPKLYPYNEDVTGMATIPPGGHYDGHYLTEKYSECRFLYTCMVPYVPLMYSDFQSIH